MNPAFIRQFIPLPYQLAPERTFCGPRLCLVVPGSGLYAKHCFSWFLRVLFLMLLISDLLYYLSSTNIFLTNPVACPWACSSREPTMGESLTDSFQLLPNTVWVSYKDTLIHTSCSQPMTTNGKFIRIRPLLHKAEFLSSVFALGLSQS